MAEKIPVPEVKVDWRMDLDQVGFIRRIFLARKWYGGDWWFVLISAVILFFIILVGVFPQWFAPYDPRAEVGPSLLAPNESPAGYYLIVNKDSGITTLEQIDTNDKNIGFIVGSSASEALRNAVAAINKEKGTNNQPRPRRYDTLDEGLKALEEKTLDGFIASREELGDALVNYLTLSTIETVTGEDRKSFILGTNQIGQDVLSRIIWGTRIALIVGLSSALAAFLLGVPLGLLAGFVSGPFDRVLTLVMDALYTFPGLILAIAIAAVLGPGIGNVVVAIAVVYIPTYYRIVRGQTLSVKQELFVEAARSLGVPPWKILTQFIFPNVIGSVVIIFSVNVADAILTEAGLSFLGLGLPPDVPDWGIDVARGQDYLRRAWWLITCPGLMVTLVTLSFSMLGESLSEILNPRLSEL